MSLKSLLLVLFSLLVALPAGAQVPAFSSASCKAAALATGGCVQEVIGARVLVVDGLTPQDCTVGGGVDQHVCVRASTGWQAEGTPAGGTLPECTLADVLAGRCIPLRPGNRVRIIDAVDPDGCIGGADEEDGFEVVCEWDGTGLIVSPVLPTDLQGRSLTNVGALEVTSLVVTSNCQNNSQIQLTSLSPTGMRCVPILTGCAVQYDEVTLLPECAEAVGTTTTTTTTTVTTTTTSTTTTTLAGFTVISHNGISFTLEGEGQTTGQFVDGEWWVVGPVTLTAMTPTYAGQRHGYEINPVTTVNDVQSLDKRVTDKVGRHVWAEPPALPRVMVAGESLVKIESNVPASTCPNNACTLGAAVLTVLGSSPPANSFRPPYSGTSKPIFSASDIVIAEKLPNLSLLSQNQITLADAEAVFAGLWIGHGDAYSSDYYHPLNNVRDVGGASEAAYGAAMATAWMSAINRTFQGTAAGGKANLVYQAVQRGIDHWYIYQNGKTWGADGGFNAGRKAAIMYAGYMLSPQNPTVTDAMINIGYTTNDFGEDGHVYLGVGGALWGRLACSSSPTPSGSDNQRRCDETRDGGQCKFGTACSGSGVQPTLAEQTSSGLFSLGAYQVYTHMYLGMATMARVLALDDEWDFAPFFTYTDRIGGPPWNAYCTGYCEQYLAEMHAEYGDGPQAPESP